MSKQDLIDHVAIYAGTSKAEALRMIDAVIPSLHNIVLAGIDVRLSPFGTFKRVTRRERQIRSLQTGEMMIVPERNVITFKQSKSR